MNGAVVRGDHVDRIPTVQKLGRAVLLQGHEGVEHPHATLDTDHNWHPQDLQVRFGQREHGDEHGHQCYPIYVDCGGHTLSPTQAATLAATLAAAEQPGTQASATPETRR